MAIKETNEDEIGQAGNVGCARQLGVPGTVVHWNAEPYVAKIALSVITVWAKPASSVSALNTEVHQCMAPTSC